MADGSAAAPCYCSGRASSARINRFLHGWVGHFPELGPAPAQGLAALRLIYAHPVPRVVGDSLIPAERGV
jgi:hypothetical protein